jgi:hypothetical protein
VNRKQLVAFRPSVLDEVERILEDRCRRTAGGLSDDAAAEALREVRRAKQLYAGEGPVRLMPRRSEGV